MRASPDAEISAGYAEDHAADAARQQKYDEQGIGDFARPLEERRFGAVQRPGEPEERYREAETDDADEFDGHVRDLRGGAGA